MKFLRINSKAGRRGKKPAGKLAPDLPFCVSAQPVRNDVASELSLAVAQDLDAMGQALQTLAERVFNTQNVRVKTGAG